MYRAYTALILKSHHFACYQVYDYVYTAAAHVYTAAAHVYTAAAHVYTAAAHVYTAAAHVWGQRTERKFNQCLQKTTTFLIPVAAPLMKYFSIQIIYVPGNKIFKFLCHKILRIVI